jgi:hypothetical protein
VGSFEQHGEYLPLITDTVVACLVAASIAADYGGLLLPRSRSRARISLGLSVAVDHGR